MGVFCHFSFHISQSAKLLRVPDLALPMQHPKLVFVHRALERSGRGATQVAEARAMQAGVMQAGATQAGEMQARAT